MMPGGMMMVVIQRLLFVIMLCMCQIPAVAVDASRSPLLDSKLTTLQRRQISWIPHHKRKQRSMKNESNIFLKIRGGDLGQIPSKRLAQSLAILALSDAIIASLAPTTSLNWMGMTMETSPLQKKNDNGRKKEKKTNVTTKALTYHYMHGIGSSAFSVAISLLLATTRTDKIPLEVAIGSGLFARLFSMTFLFGQVEDLGMNEPMFGIMWTVLAATVIAIFAPEIFLLSFIDAMTLTKVISLLICIHGFFLYCDPNIFVHKVSPSSGQLDKEDDTAINVASINGGYMAVSGLVTYLLASGISPTRVAGYASLAYMPVLLKLFSTIKVEKFMGINPRAIAVMSTTMMATIAVGTLHHD